MNGSAANQSVGPEAPIGMVFMTEPLGLRVFRLTVYVIIFLLATFGNALVIFVVYKTRELHTGKTFNSLHLLTTVFSSQKLIRGLQKGMINQVTR